MPVCSAWSSLWRRVGSARFGVISYGFLLPFSQVMTYMSIADAIRAHLDAGNLQAYHPPYVRGRPERRLFLTKEAAKELNDPNSAVNLLCGKGYLHAALTKWTMKGLINGDARRGRFLFRLDPPPPEVWEIRVTEPNVQGRLLGRFAERDTLILMRMHTRRLLGDKDSPEWNDAMRDCVKQWDNLFPGVSPLTGATIFDYVTENCDDFPLARNNPPRRARARRLRGCAPS